MTCGCQIFWGEIYDVVYIEVYLGYFIGFNTMDFCEGCHRKTPIVGAVMTHASNDWSMVKGKCVVCGRAKSRFVADAKKSKRGGDLQ